METTNLPTNLPRAIRGGFNRDDYADASDELQFLHGGIAPFPGMWVKVQVEFAKPMKCALDWNGGTTRWALFAGPITDVRERKGRFFVDADVVASSDNAPRALGGDWKATLSYDCEFENPWVLVGMSRSKPGLNERRA